MYLCNAAAWLCCARVAATTTKKMVAALKTLALGEIRRTIIRMENYSFVASRGCEMMMRSLSGKGDKADEYTHLFKLRT